MLCSGSEPVFGLTGELGFRSVGGRGLAPSHCTWCPDRGRPWKLCCWAPALFFLKTGRLRELCGNYFGSVGRSLSLKSSSKDSALFRVTHTGLELGREGDGRRLPSWAVMAHTCSHTGTETSGPSLLEPHSHAPLKAAPQRSLLAIKDCGALGSLMAALEPPHLEWDHPCPTCMPHEGSGVRAPTPIFIPVMRKEWRDFVSLQSHGS